MTGQRTGKMLALAAWAGVFALASTALAEDAAPQAAQPQTAQPPVYGGPYPGYPGMPPGYAPPPQNSAVQQPVQQQAPAYGYPGGYGGYPGGYGGYPGGGYPGGGYPGGGYGGYRPYPYAYGQQPPPQQAAPQPQQAAPQPQQAAPQPQAAPPAAVVPQPPGRDGLLGMSMMGAPDSAERMDARLKATQEALVLNDTQLPLWTSFSEAVRKQSQARREMHAQNPGVSPNSADWAKKHFDMMESMHAARRGAMEAYVKLFQVLDPKQRAIADRLSGLPY